MTEKIIEFECVYGTAKFAGYAYAEDLDDDEPLHFYDRNLGSQTSLQNAHFEGTEEDQINLHEAFTGDFMFTQWLSDCQDESITVDRGDYTLHINGGTQLEMSIEKVDEWHRGDYLNAKISFKFGDVVLDDDLLEELCDLIACTWNADEIYKTKSGENAICLIIDYDWWDDSYDADLKESVEKEMIADAEKLFVRQVIMDRGVYFEYQKILKEFLMKHDDKRIFDKSYIRGAANNYEQILEECNLTEINSFCEKSLKEEMLNDIKEGYYE